MAINKKLLVCIVLLTITGDELFAQLPATVPAQPVSTANVEYEIGKKQVITRLELNQSTVLDATRLISEVSGINVVATQAAGIVEISLFLRHVKTIDAIETLCKVGGLWYREEEEVGLVRRWLWRWLWRWLAAGFGGATDQLQALGNQDPAQAGGISSERLQEVTSQEPPIHVAINQTHGMIIVRTSDKIAMSSIANLIEQLDRPTPQVLLEVRILEVTLGDQFKSAFDFEFSQNKTTPAVGDPAFVPSNLVNTATEQFIGPGASYLNNGGSALGSGNFDVEADGSTFVYQFLDQNFRARVQLLEEENRVNVVATPILLASNNRPASLRIGEERRFTDSASTITNANQGGQTVGTNIETSDQQIGTSLMMLPKINADRTVTLTIFQERTGDDTGKQDIIPISATQTVTRPVVSNATTVNTVVAKDGLTVAIGGMVEEKVVKRQLKVPLLGDIPTLGALFRKDFEQEQKTELIILITPHVISTPKQSEKATQEFLTSKSHHPYIRNGYKSPATRPQMQNLPEAYGTQTSGRLFQQPSQD